MRLSGWTKVRGERLRNVAVYDGRLDRLSSARLPLRWLAASPLEMSEDLLNDFTKRWVNFGLIKLFYGGRVDVQIAAPRSLVASRFYRLKMFFDCVHLRSSSTVPIPCLPSTTLFYHGRNANARVARYRLDTVTREKFPSREIFEVYVGILDGNTSGTHAEPKPSCFTLATCGTRQQKLLLKVCEKLA
jgi:hypothetical protein